MDLVDGLQNPARLFAFRGSPVDAGGRDKAGVNMCMADAFCLRAFRLWLLEFIDDAHLEWERCFLDSEPTRPSRPVQTVSAFEESN